MTPAEYESLHEIAEQARTQLGVTLFTVTVILPGATEVARVYTTHPEVYPVGGRKSLDPSYTSPIWLEQVVVAREPFFGPDVAAVREFFADSDVIERLGCGAIINTPVVADDQVIGSINFLAAAGVFDATSVAVAGDLTVRATPAVAAAMSAVL